MVLITCFIKDPWPDLTAIFVAVDNSDEGKGKIVSTVKVYQRELFLNGRIVRVGGIGEVSTSAQYQKRGLASRLLEVRIHLLSICKNNCKNLDLSDLYPDF